MPDHAAREKRLSLEQDYLLEMQTGICEKHPNPAKAFTPTEEMQANFLAALTNAPAGVSLKTLMQPSRDAG